MLISNSLPLTILSVFSRKNIACKTNAEQSQVFEVRLKSWTKMTKANKTQEKVRIIVKVNNQKLILADRCIGLIRKVENILNFPGLIMMLTLYMKQCYFMK